MSGNAWIAAFGAMGLVFAVCLAVAVATRRRGRDRWVRSLTVLTGLPTGPWLMPLKSLFPGVGTPGEPYGARSEHALVERREDGNAPPGDLRRTDI